MDLTRYWRGQSGGRNIEVQWTGFRLTGGWILRLFVDGELKAERKVPRWAQNFEIQDGPVKVNFWGNALRHRCRISSGETVITDTSQPWNALAFAIILAAMVVIPLFALIVITLRSWSAS
jgi:hypothetical protein